MNRDEALRVLEAHVENQNLIKHMLAAEAIMGALARRLGEDERSWRLAGLLHDLDAEMTGDSMDIHGVVTVRWLREEGLEDEAILHAIAAHNAANGSTVESRMDRALFAGDPLTGLVTAAALIRPEKRLEAVELKSLKKRFKEPSFAKGARREDMMTCTELGIDLEEFLAIGLEAMKEISDELGL